jgi:cell division protein FtsA
MKKNIKPEQIITAVDVGTTKICVLIATHNEDDSLTIAGIGKVPSHGLKKGVVVDVAKTVDAIKQALKDAEHMAGFAAQAAGVGVSGAHISAINSLGMVPIRGSAITAYDVHQVLAAAKAIPIPEGQQILHVLPQYFVIDGREHVLQPIGMHAIRLEVHAHIIMGSVGSVQNLVKCCEYAGLNINDIVLEQLASADAVLSTDEKELGVALLDIGGGTSDFAVYRNGTIWHTKVIPIAGNHFTQDLAIGLRITLDDAERIKHTHGLIDGSSRNLNELIEVEMIQKEQTKHIPLRESYTILESRAHELLNFVHQEMLTKEISEKIPSGLVLTGGGALLTGLAKYAEKICGVPVRIGIPHQPGIHAALLNSPQLATGYGLLLYLAQKKMSGINQFEGPLVQRVFNRMRSWVSELF